MSDPYDPREAIRPGDPDGRAVPPPPLPDEWDVAIPRRTPFPGTIMAGGIFWILAGAFNFGLFLLLRLLDQPLGAADVCLGIAAFFFIKDGIQLIRGTFRDPLADGILTMLIGVFFVGKAAWDVVHGVFPLVAVFLGFAGMIFLVPGVLVMIGRRQYLDWRSEHGRD